MSSCIFLVYNNYADKTARPYRTDFGPFGRALPVVSNYLFRASGGVENFSCLLFFPPLEQSEVGEYTALIWW